MQKFVVATPSDWIRKIVNFCNELAMAFDSNPKKFWDK